MNSQLHLSDSAEGVVTRPAEHIGLKGRFIFKLERDGKVIDEWESPNLVTNIGRNTVLNTAIGGVTQIAVWYIGLIDNAGFSALAAGDTMASHAGWTENASYSNASRPTYSPAAASSQSITNAASVATFNINGTATINGAFITSNNTISGTSGTLLCEASFGSTRSVISGDTLAVTYVLND
jgi:hypothetical protein